MWDTSLSNRKVINARVNEKIIDQATHEHAVSNPWTAIKAGAGRENGTQLRPAWLFSSNVGHFLN